MLGLVDYSSDEESVPATQIKSQTIASTDGVEATTLKSSSADADLTNKTSQVVSQRIKKSQAKQKRKRSTRDIVSALGLDKELEEILNDEKKEDAINDHFEEVRTTTRSTKRQKKITTTTTAAAITNQLNEENEVVSAYQSTADRDIDNDDYDMNNRQQQAPLLSDDFFDHLHEYQVPDVPSQYEASMDASTYLYPGGGSSGSGASEDVGATAFGSTSSSSISQEHLPAEVLRDLQRSSASIIEVNSVNRGSSYLDEVMKRQLAAEKHKNLTAGQSTGQIPQKAISNTQRSRNQLSYLAHNAQVNELENAERAATGRANKQAAWRKYGWM